MSQSVGPDAASYEIRPLSLAETLDAGFQLLKNHFTLLSVLSLIVQVPTVLVFMIFGWMLDPFAAQTGEKSEIQRRSRGRSGGHDWPPAGARSPVAPPVASTILILAPVVRHVRAGSPNSTRLR